MAEPEPEPEAEPEPEPEPARSREEWIALAAERAAAGDREGAVEALEACDPGMPLTEEDGWLMHRLAAYRLLAGDRPGFARTAGRIPRGTTARDLHARFGIPSEEGVVAVDPPEERERLVLGPRGVGKERVVVTGRDDGLRAFVVRPRGLSDPLLVPSDSLDAAAVAAHDEVRSLVDEGKVLPAMRRAEAAVEADPQNPALLLLFAEALTAEGEVGRALQQLNRLAKVTPVVGGTVIDRRIRALAGTGAGKTEEAFAELEAIRAANPDYLPVYEDLYGLYLATYRFREALDVLVAAGERWPEVREDGGYRESLRLAWLGFAKRVEGREDVERFASAADPEIRQVAVRLSVGLERADAEAVLVGLAADSDATVRTLAIRFLGERAYEGGADACAARLGDEDPKVRAAAARSVALLRGRPAVDALLDLLDDDDGYVRDVVVRELRRLSGREFGFDPRAGAEERAAAAAKWREWAGGD
jgi:tetratricopeptide (TPR) repeat protein